MWNERKNNNLKNLSGTCIMESVNAGAPQPRCELISEASFKHRGVRIESVERLCWKPRRGYRMEQ